MLHRHTFVARCLVFVLGSVVATALAGATPSHPAPPQESAMVTDEDGVQMLYASAPGTW